MILQIGIIGAGTVVRVRHLPETHSNPHTKVAAICDIVESRVNEMAAQYDCKAYTDYKDLVQDPEIDAVIVAATNTTHAEMSIAALNAGKHVLCEKPMATNLADAKNMLDAASKSGKQLMIAHNQRLENAHIKAKQLINSGKLGKILTFTTVFGHPGSEDWAIDGEDTWFYKKDITGLGVLGDLAIHKLDLVRWLIDDDFTEAMAMLGTLSKTYPSGELIDVKDNAVCLLSTKKGVLGTMIASWSYQKEENSTKIYGQNGVMEINTHPDYPLIIHYDHEQAEFHKTGKQSTNVQQVKSGVMDAFADALINEKEVPIPGIEGYKALEAVIACQVAYQEGNKVTIEKL